MGGTWTASSDRTLRDVRLVGWTCASGHPENYADREPMALFRGDTYIRCLAGSSSLSWPFYIDIATL
jgi:hypothetical protein